MFTVTLQQVLESAENCCQPPSIDIFLTHREEEIVKQHREVSNALRIKIDGLEQEKENVKEVTR